MEHNNDQRYLINLNVIYISSGMIKEISMFLKKWRFYVIILVMLVIPLLTWFITKSRKKRVRFDVASDKDVSDKDNSLLGTNFLCRDANPVYHCSSLERCGKGACVPEGKIRCDDSDSRRTYDCNLNETCGKGRCLAEGHKICGRSTCSPNESCCQGANETNDLLSCFASSSCPRGSITVKHYHHDSYRVSRA
jgi:hypothetical protein